MVITHWRQYNNYCTNALQTRAVCALAMLRSLIIGFSGNFQWEFWTLASIITSKWGGSVTGVSDRTRQLVGALVLLLLTSLFVTWSTFFFRSTRHSQIIDSKVVCMCLPPKPHVEFLLLVLWLKWRSSLQWPLQVAVWCCWASRVSKVVPSKFLSEALDFAASGTKKSRKQIVVSYLL